MEQFAEDEQLSKISEMISDNFSGNGGADKQAVKRMLFVLFKKRDNIHLLTQIQEIEFPDKKTAEVELVAGSREERGFFLLWKVSAPISCISVYPEV